MSQTLADGAVHVEGLWKRFRADRDQPVLTSELTRLRDSLRGRSDHHWRWALRDIEFSIAPGEAVGLIGVNGSGKSTLLRLMSRVMYPYYGDVRVGGRVGALIEIDAGLHDELTGRENIYLYGALCGLSDRDMDRGFDDIVDFAGLETAIDRQVKYYSSGMRMRLGFTVAVASRPDVLLIDEVLAVGDSLFQAKCIVRITEALRQGTTVVFVTHDLMAVQGLCSRAIWLAGGRLVADGPARDILMRYRMEIERSSKDAANTGRVRFRSGRVLNGEGANPTTQGPADISFGLESDAPGPGLCRVYIGVSEGTSAPIFTARQQVALVGGQQELVCHIRRLPLARGRYYLWMDAIADNGDILMEWQPVLEFEVDGPDLHGAPVGLIRLAPIHVDTDWEA